MRISDSIRFQSVTRSLASLASQQAEASRRASTGERVGAPSADPIAAADLSRMRSALAQNATHQKAINTVRGDVELAEGILDQATAILRRMDEISVQGANGALSADERTALAEEVAELKEELVSIANTKGGRGYIFGGTATDSRPFSAAGAFTANNDVQEVEVGPGLRARVNVSGADAFTASGGVDVFASVDALETALRTDNQAGVAASLDSIHASTDQLVRARADAGVILNRLDASDAALQKAELALTERQTDVGGADPYDTYTDLVQVGQSIERAIAVSRSTLNNNLLRFT